MILRKNNFVFYLYNNHKNAIYNKITDPGTGNSVYPDILFRHTLPECELLDGNAYKTSTELMSQSGSAHCIFLSCTGDKVLSEIIDSAVSTECKKNTFRCGDEVSELCSDLSLSVTMQNLMKQLLTYYSYHGNVSELIQNIYKRTDLPVSKVEGKKIYEKVREFILQ